MFDRYPFMKEREDWRWFGVSPVLRLGVLLDALPENERARVMRIIERHEVAPRLSLELLDNLTRMASETRLQVYYLADEDDRPIETVLFHARVAPKVAPRLERLRADITREQYRWLWGRAHEQMKRDHGRRLDLAAVLRDILDDAMKRHGANVAESAAP